MAVWIDTITFTHTNADVGLTSTEMLAALGASSVRKFVLLQNISDAIVDIKVGAAAVAGEGIRIYPGVTIELKPGSGNFDPRAINGIQADAGTKTVLVTEGV